MTVKNMELDEKQLDKQYLIVKYSFFDQKPTVVSQALIGCRVSGFAFVDENFVCQHKFPFSWLKVYLSLEVIDREPIETGDITLISYIICSTRIYSKNLHEFVANFEHNPLVLSIQ